MVVALPEQILSVDFDFELAHVSLFVECFDLTVEYFLFGFEVHEERQAHDEIDGFLAELAPPGQKILDDAAMDALVLAQLLELLEILQRVDAVYLVQEFVVFGLVACQRF